MDQTVNLLFLRILSIQNGDPMSVPDFGYSDPAPSGSPRGQVSAKPHSLIQAVILPYQAPFRNQLVFGAAGVMVLCYIIVFIPSFMVALVMNLGNLLTGHKGDNPLSDLLANLIGIIVYAFPLGFQWRFLAHRQSPENHPMPRWFEDPLGCWLDGLKLNLYFFVLNLILGISVFLIALVLALGFGLSAGTWSHAFSMPASNSPEALVVILVMILVIGVLIVASVLLLGPFYWAPVIYGAQRRTLAALFDWRTAFFKVCSRYGQAIIAMALTLGVTFLYGIAILISFLTIIGWVFLIFPSQISAFILINDALWDREMGDLSADDQTKHQTFSETQDSGQTPDTLY